MLTTKSPVTIPPFGIPIGRDPFPGAGVRVVGPQSNLISSLRGWLLARHPLGFGPLGFGPLGFGLDDGRAERRRHREREAADDDDRQPIVTTDQLHQRALVG